MPFPTRGFGFEATAEPPSSETLARAWKPYIETCIEAFGARPVVRTLVLGPIAASMVAGSSFAVSATGGIKLTDLPDDIVYL